MCVSALLRADGVAVNGGSRELKGDPQRVVEEGEGRGRAREKFDLSAITIGDWTLTGSCASCGDA